MNVLTNWATRGEGGRTLDKVSRSWERQTQVAGLIEGKQWREIETVGCASDQDKAGGYSPAETAEGIALSQALIDAVAPILNGQKADLGIDALAAAFMASLGAANVSQRDAKLLLFRYAERIVDYAEEL